jgi:hypothetical protein
MVVTVAMLSMAFPQASKHIVSNRRRLAAAQLANAEVERLRAQPYAYVDPTPLGSSNTQCDCQSDDFTVIPSSISLAGGVAYSLQSCVNFVLVGSGNTWTPQCPVSGDTGYKNVLVRVSWAQGTESHFVTESTMKAHS